MTMMPVDKTCLYGTNESYAFDFHGTKVIVVIVVFARSSTVLVSTSASILKPSSLGWLLFIWRFFDSWEMRQKLGTTVTASRLEEITERLFGRETLEALGIATRR